MKKIIFMTMAFASMLLASCMGDGYADPDTKIEVTVPPCGNNYLKEHDVITIAKLKEDYNSQIVNKQYTQIKDGIQIKGIITGNDIGGNLYNEVCLQDETGGILVCVNRGALYGTLPVGQEVLIDLKGLYIGGYGSQAELGGIYTNSSTGAQSIGKVDRYEWEKHYKLIDDADPSKAKALMEVFDKTKIKDADYLKSCAGKLMTIEKVQFTAADGKEVFADENKKDKANCVNVSLTDAETGQAISTSDLVVRTSAYAKFANVALTKEPVNITGIFTRNNNTWQILLRDINDLEQTTLSVFSEPFSESQGDFKIENITPANGVTAVWNWANANYGMKASGYNSKSYANCSRLTSPAIDLSKVQEATLTLDHAINKTSDDPKKECKIQVSTDGKNWEDVEADVYPAGNSWNFVTSTINLNKYCGKKIYISFLYTSTDNSAPTWEIKNILVK